MVKRTLFLGLMLLMLLAACGSSPAEQPAEAGLSSDITVYRSPT